MVEKKVGRKKGEKKMSVAEKEVVVRHCSPAESLERAIKEVKAIKKGEKNARSWWDFLKQRGRENK